MKRTTVESMDRLPQWAQSRIRVLEANLASAKTEIDNLTGTIPSRICIPAMPTSWDKDRFLPDRTDLEFKYGPQLDEEIEVGLYDEHGEVGVRVSGGSGTLSVRPVASNLVVIFAKR